MQEDNKYKIVNLNTTTPKSEENRSTIYGRYDANGNFIPDGKTYKTSSVSEVAPDDATLSYFKEHIAPTIAKKYGVTVNEKGEVVLDTPLSKFMGYDVEAERKRREKEKELNEFRRKEANWYNGISVLMDIAGAAAGANVQKRTPTTVAADAIAANEALRKEGLSEEVAIEKAKQERIAGFLNEYADQISKLKKKVTTSTEDKPSSHTITHKPKVVQTREQVVKLRDDEDDSINNIGKRTYSIGVRTTNNGVSKWDKAQVSKEDYEHIGNLLANYYQKVLKSDLEEPQYESTDLENRADRKAAKSRNKELENAFEEQTNKHAIFKEQLKKQLDPYHYTDITNGTYHWDIDRMLSDGIFYELPEDIKNAITTQTNGRVTFGEPIQMSNGLKRETVIIKNDSKGNGFIPTPPLAETPM